MARGDYSSPPAVVEIFFLLWLGENPQRPFDHVPANHRIRPSLFFDHCERERDIFLSPSIFSAVEKKDSHRSSFQDLRNNRTTIRWWLASFSDNGSRDSISSLATRNKHQRFNCHFYQTATWLCYSVNTAISVTCVALSPATSYQICCRFKARRLTTSNELLTGNPLFLRLTMICKSFLAKRQQRSRWQTRPLLQSNLRETPRSFSLQIQEPSLVLISYGPSKIGSAFPSSCCRCLCNW